MNSLNVSEATIALLCISKLHEFGLNLSQTAILKDMIIENEVSIVQAIQDHVNKNSSIKSLLRTFLDIVIVHHDESSKDDFDLNNTHKGKQNPIEEDIQSNKMMNKQCNTASSVLIVESPTNSPRKNGREESFTFIENESPEQDVNNLVVDEMDISILTTQFAIDRDEAAQAIVDNNGDLVEAIVQLDSTMQRR